VQASSGWPCKVAEEGHWHHQEDVRLLDKEPTRADIGRVLLVGEWAGKGGGHAGRRGLQQAAGEGGGRWAKTAGTQWVGCREIVDLSDRAGRGGAGRGRGMEFWLSSCSSVGPAEPMKEQSLASPQANES
jgi:hypothetical protein